MDLLTTDRILTLAGFLGALLLVWVFIRIKSAPLAARLKQGRQLEVREVLSLGGDARAVLMRAKDRDVLIVTGRKSGTALLTLSDTETAEDQS